MLRTGSAAGETGPTRFIACLEWRQSRFLHRHDESWVYDQGSDVSAQASKNAGKMLRADKPDSRIQSFNRITASTCTLSLEMTSRSGAQAPLATSRAARLQG
jgi:hypothetical protein